MAAVDETGGRANPVASPALEAIAPKSGDSRAQSRGSDCEAYYRQLYAKCGNVLTESLAKFGKDQTRSHNCAHDLGKWLGVIRGRPEEPMLQLALREYQFALLALVLGQYRHAFLSLRVFLEVALSMVQFSAHEQQLREWLKGGRDINWTHLVGEDGIFSRNFAAAFYEDLADDVSLYGSIAGKIYRECSEYVHSNAQAKVPTEVCFDATLFHEWHEKARNAVLIITFALCLRYFCLLTDAQKEALESTVMAELSHVPAIRSFFGATTAT